MELRSHILTPDPPSSKKSKRPVSSSSHRDSPSSHQKYPLWRIIAGWLVHFYTATGLFVNLYSLLHALFGNRPSFSFFAKLNWLAILIDATDGTFARAVDVKRVIPGYDGALLDNIIDFQTFAILPALAVVKFQLVPGELLQFVLACVVVLASAYAFCQTLAKTDEAFVGFPSYWNIVVFYCYYLDAGVVATVLTFLICGVLSFVPIHFIYPTRTRKYFYWNLGGAYVWGALMLIPTFWPESEYVALALYSSFLYVIYYVGMSVFLDMERRRDEAHEA